MPLLDPLVDVPTLVRHHDDPRLRVLDATVVFPAGEETGRDRYERGHLPGAAFADLAGSLSDPDAPLPFTVPSAARFASEVGALGVGQGTHVVVYSDTTPMWATRLWWLLRFFGFSDVSVLDGGLAAWRAAGRPLSDAPARYAPAEFAARPRPELLATRAEVEAIAAGAPACLLNALPEASFRGEQPSAGTVAGRIPGSTSLAWTRLVEGDEHRVRPREQLRSVLADAGALGDAPVVAYCGGGISATVDLFALALVGAGDARLYDGSMADWAADPALPLASG